MEAARISLVLSASILAGYREVGEELASAHEDIEFESFAALLLLNSEVVDAPEYLDPGVCADAADDKFLACAAASGATHVISGDKQLIATSGWNGIHVLTPRAYFEQYLKL